ncbi:predicted protein [Postia placenta Mad-698-R]|nr:predicted protein [Postia placenta Mad-698-R]
MPGISLKRHTLVVRSYVKEGYLPSGAAEPLFTTMCMHKPAEGDLKEEVSGPRPGCLTLTEEDGQHMLRGAAVAPDIGEMARTPEVHDTFRPERFAALSPGVAALVSKTRGSPRLDSVADEPRAMQSRNCTI